MYCMSSYPLPSSSCFPFFSLFLSISHACPVPLIAICTSELRTSMAMNSPDKSGHNKKHRLSAVQVCFSLALLSNFVLVWMKICKKQGFKLPVLKHSLIPKYIISPLSHTQGSFKLLNFELYLCVTMLLAVCVGTSVPLAAFSLP